jgi:hypothetical protein
MKRSVCVVAAAAVLALLSGTAWAQGAPKTESFVGVVKAVSGTSLTLERGTITGVFTFDSKTHVSVRGATAKTNENKAAGKPGLTVPDVVHVGDQVNLKFQEKNNAMVASNIIVITSLQK